MSPTWCCPWGAVVRPKVEAVGYCRFPPPLRLSCFRAVAIFFGGAKYEDSTVSMNVSPFLFLFRVGRCRAALEFACGTLMFV